MPFKSINVAQLPIYPILFSMYPVVALLGVNISEVEASVVWRPLLVLAGAALVCMFLLRLFLRDWQRAALAASLLALLFFTYGRAYEVVKNQTLGGFIVGRHRYLLVMWILLAALAVWWAWKKVKRPQTFTSTLNLISVFLLIYPSYQAISYTVREAQTARQAAAQDPGSERADLPLGYAPDIYYIILDAYGRADVLEEMFGYDNIPFLNDLEEMGFYVADCGQSNYGQTMLSLTSSLNMNYLDTLTDQLDPNGDNRAPLRALGKHNAVRAFLEAQGYKTVSFATNFPVSEWKDADYFLSPPPQGMNEFEIMLAQTSVARAPMDMVSETPEQRTGEWYRRRTLFTLQQLEEVVPNLSGPKFVFAHLVIPHHPFVFGPNGEEVRESVSDVARVPDFPVYLQGYSDHVTYINKRMEEIVRVILEMSPYPPLIIIQGDHGPAPFDVIERRMKILNVYYLPGADEDLYATITPVNSFRVIFNHYFGQAYEMLDDISFYSAYDIPYNYTIVPNTCGN